MTWARQLLQQLNKPNVGIRNILVIDTEFCCADGDTPVPVMVYFSLNRAPGRSSWS